MDELTQTLLEIRKRERSRLVKTTLLITEAQDNALKAINQRTRVPTSVRLREAIEFVIERYTER